MITTSPQNCNDNIAKSFIVHESDCVLEKWSSSCAPEVECTILNESSEEKAEFWMLIERELDDISKEDTITVVDLDDAHDQVDICWVLLRIKCGYEVLGG
jgi:hypothetical protein